jgi:hypothetical protein
METRRMNTQLELTDSIRVDFLLRLDAAEFEVTEWEAKFLASFMKRPDARTAHFSDAQRTSIDKMRRMYEPRLPSGGDAASPGNATGASRLPPAPAGTCGYLVRDAAEGRQRRCGLPAVTQNRLGLEFCADHEKQRAESAARLREIKDRKLRS